MKRLKKEQKDFENEILSQLMDKIRNSEYVSKFVNEKAIPVEIYNYIELAIIDDCLRFIDFDGLHYSLFAICDLNDLIEILESL